MHTLDKTLFSYISTPDGKGGNIIFSPFKRHVLCQGDGKRERKNKTTEDGKEKKKSHCILDKEMSKFKTCGLLFQIY